VPHKPKPKKPRTVLQILLEQLRGPIPTGEETRALLQKPGSGGGVRVNYPAPHAGPLGSRDLPRIDYPDAATVGPVQGQGGTPLREHPLSRKAREFVIDQPLLREENSPVRRALDVAEWSPLFPARIAADAAARALTGQPQEPISLALGAAGVVPFLRGSTAKTVAKEVKALRALSQRTPGYAPGARAAREELLQRLAAGRVTAPTTKVTGTSLPKAFSILTAQNPGGLPADAAANRASNEALERELRRRGYNPQPVKGGYRDSETGQFLQEDSFLVPGLPESEAASLGRRFGQNSVITQQGLHDLKSGMTTPSKGVLPGTEDVYTELPGGERFMLDLDWDNPIPMRLRESAVTEISRKRGLLPSDEEVLGLAPNRPFPDPQTGNIVPPMLLGLTGAGAGGIVGAAGAPEDASESERLLRALGGAALGGVAGIATGLPLAGKGGPLATVPAGQGGVIPLSRIRRGGDLFIPSVLRETNLPGAKITPKGWEVDLQRFQKAEQAGKTAPRTGVHYVVPGHAKKDAAFFKRGGLEWYIPYGGPQEISGRTAFKRPLVVQGVTGGGVGSDKALSAMLGEEKFDDVMREARALAGSMTGEGAYTYDRATGKAVLDPSNIEKAVRAFLVKHGGDASVAGEIAEHSLVKAEGKRRPNYNRLFHFIKENLAASHARTRGHDAIVSLGKGRVSEVFDLREASFPLPPTNAPTKVRPEFLSQLRNEGGAIGYTIEGGGRGESGLDRFLRETDYGRTSPKSIQQWIGFLQKNVGKGGYSKEELEATFGENLKRLSHQFKEPDQAKKYGEKLLTRDQVLQRGTKVPISVTTLGADRDPFYLSSQVAGDNSVLTFSSQNMEGYLSDEGPLRLTVPRLGKKSYKAIKDAISHSQSIDDAIAEIRSGKNAPEVDFVLNDNGVETKITDATARFQKVADELEAHKYWFPKKPKGEDVAFPLSGMDPAYEKYVVPDDDAARYREHLFSVPSMPGQRTFKEPHWEDHVIDENIVAHVRTTDRSRVSWLPVIPLDGFGNPPGRRLHVEELQSEWLQRAREAGTFDEKKTEELRRQVLGAKDRANIAYNRYYEAVAKEKGYDPLRDALSGTRPSISLAQLSEEKKAADTEYRRLGKLLDEARAAPPKPPIPANTQAWVGLTMKQMLDRAAREGYDQLSWNPGEIVSQIVGGKPEGQKKFYDEILPNWIRSYLGRISHEGWEIVPPARFSNYWRVKMSPEFRELLKKAPITLPAIGGAAALSDRDRSILFPS
jgi:hypothetical protein